MTYFTEITGYQTYAKADADFHFSYNANSGGGQSFLGGMFVNEKNELTSPTVLDGYIGIFRFVYKDANRKDVSVILDDIKCKYEIKPRGTGSNSMKLSVGTKLENPSKIISSLFMLPPTCTIKNPVNLDVSILSSNNFWLQSMWLKCDIHSNSKQVYLIPNDFVFCGGSNKDKQGNERFFKLEAEKRIADIISLSKNEEHLPNELVHSINVFSDIYLGKEHFNYENCVQATKRIMALLAKEYPTEYAGIEDPLPFLKSLARMLNTKEESTNAAILRGHKEYLVPLRTKPFMLLAGISGTGKSRIVRKLAQATVTEELQKAEGYKGTDFANDRWTLHSPANFELIQVKPNWHNSMDVIGYLSNIPSPHYVFTPFIEFIVKAWQHPEVPFFLCLDEMNLAPVEEYFAEFLSAIESRSFEGGEYMTDPIIKPFNSFGTTKDENDVDINIGDMMIDTLFPKVKASNTNSEILKIKEHFQTKGLTLPKNLIVIGTVNMDETTFSFSRKVLDRAMSVEMNEVNYDSFLNDTTDDDLKAIVKSFEENDDADLNALLVDRHIEAREIIDELGEDAKFTIDYLKRINALLEGTPFKLGYRAANEALIYLQASKEFGQPNCVAALDNFTLMKILSRIEGDETKLKITTSEADKERIAKAEVNVDEAKQYGDLNILTALRHIITNQLGEQDKLHSIRKIDSMLSQLKRDHFVSFWN